MVSEAQLKDQINEALHPSTLVTTILLLLDIPYLSFCAGQMLQTLAT